MLGVEVLGGCWVVGGGCGVKNGFICGLRRLLGRWCSAAGVAFEVPCEVWWAVLWGLGGVLWAGAAGVLLRRCSAFMLCLLPTEDL